MNTRFPLYFLFGLLLLTSREAVSQQKFSGTWRGASIDDSFSYKNIYEIEMKIINGLVEGSIKIENTNGQVLVKKIIGNKKYINLTLKEKGVINAQNKKQKFDNSFYCLKYNLQRGYLEGSKDSSLNSKIILFKEDFPFSSKSKPIKNKHWVDPFIMQYHAGISAPEKRIEELKNFVFKPIYFDVDKSTIKPEDHIQLEEIVKITKSHSDLRVKVIGHTDSDGSETYNTGLSKRRAQSIIDFFSKRGLRRDRIVIDFRGENEPAETNSTKEGKRKNRRVDFTFI